MQEAPHDPASLDRVFNELQARLQRLETQAAPRSSIKPHKPSVFDGSNNRNTETWLFEVEVYLRATGTLDPECVPVVATFLKDVALQWWQADLTHRELHHLPPLTMWGEFKAAFRHRFLPIEASRTARAMLQTIRQRHSVHDYCNRFMKQLALIHDMAEADRIEYFTRGLQPVVQKEVVLKSPTTLDEAMHLAARCDLLLASRGFRQSSSSYRPPARGSYYPSSGYRHSSSYSSANSQGAQPMELGKMEHDDFDQPEYDDATPSDPADSDAGADFHAMQSSYNGRTQPKTRVPNISRDEFQRCRRLGLCLRCKQSGHVARNCTASAAPSRSGSQHPKAAAQRK